MDSAKLNDWLQVVGIFALVASLIFVGMQMRQDRTLASVEAMSSRVEASVGLADLIGSNKVVWVSGLSGVELSEADRATFQSMVEAVELHFVAQWVRVGAIGGGRSAESVIGDYAFAIYSHAGLRQVWMGQGEYWRLRNIASDTGIRGDGFRALVNSSLSQLDKNAPPLPTEIRYVFS